MCLKKKEIITFLNACPCAIVGAMKLKWRKTLPGDNKGGCDHPAAGQVPACCSLDINRTALYVHAVLPASRDAFSSEKYEKNQPVS